MGVLILVVLLLGVMPGCLFFVGSFAKKSVEGKPDWISFPTAAETPRRNRTAKPRQRPGI